MDDIHAVGKDISCFVLYTCCSLLSAHPRTFMVPLRLFLGTLGIQEQYTLTLV